MILIYYINQEPKHSTSSCELMTLWTATSRISSSINESRPVHRLPPEVLAAIFTCYQRLESTKRYKWFTWVRLMSVSHRWRSTILSFPSLWSVIRLGGEISSEGIRALLERSRGHPLHVIVLRSGFSTPKSIRYSHALDASAHTHRIQKLLLYLDLVEDDVKRIVRIFSKPAQNLAHLELAGYSPHDMTTPFPDLFGLEFPKLRVLEVAGIGAWPKVVGTNLTHITFNTSLNPWVLQDCIPYSPNLKVLEIRGVSNLTMPNFSRWQRIALPPGVCLTIGRTPLCSHILMLFILPHDAHIRACPSIIAMPDRPLLSYILPFETSNLHNLGALTRLHAKARIDLYAYVALELECFSLDRPAFEVNVEHSFDLKTMDEEEASPVLWFLGNLKQIALEGLEELRLDGFVGRLAPQEAELLAFLKRLPALKRLITTNSNEKRLRSALDILGYPAVVVRVEG